MLSFKFISLLFPIFTCGILSIFLFFNYNNNLSKRIMSLLMTVGFVFSLSILFNQTGYYLLYSYFAPLYYAMMLLMPTLFYFYVKSLTTISFKFQRFYFHLFPSVLYFLVSLVLFSLLDNNNRVEYIGNLNLGVNNYNGIFFLLHLVFVSHKFVFSAQILFYFFLIRKEIIINNKLINNTFSNNSELKLNWLYIINFIFLLGGLNGLIINFLPTTHVKIDETSLGISLILFSVFFILLSFMANNQKSIILEIEENDKIVLKKDTILNEEALIKRIDDYLLNNEAYKNPNLNIWHLVNELYVNRTYISQAINKEKGQNFNSYINTIRIEQVLKRLNNNELNYRTISEECGFKSLSTFYRCFKNYTKITPSEYIKSIQK